MKMKNRRKQKELERKHKEAEIALAKVGGMMKELMGKIESMEAIANKNKMIDDADRFMREQLGDEHDD